MIHVNLPYDCGTFVRAKDKYNGNDILGTVAAYTVTDDGWLVWVSEYKEAFCGEYLPEEIEPMSELEIKELKARYHEE